MFLPHAAGVVITLGRLCSVFYVVYLDIPLRWEYHRSCILYGLFGYSLKTGLSPVIVYTM